VSVLAIPLSAPLQSWGSASKFSARRTEKFPTRSGLLSMFDAALGIQTCELQQKPEHHCVKFIVFSFSEPRVLSDFHTVGGGVTDNPVFQANQKPSKNAALTRREYLQDAKFGVIVSGEDSVLQKIHTALRDPVYGVWFGRKSCSPTRPVFGKLLSSEEEALKYFSAEVFSNIDGKAAEVKFQVREVPKYSAVEAAEALKKFELHQISDELAYSGKREFQYRSVAILRESFSETKPLT